MLGFFAPPPNVPRRLASQRPTRLESLSLRGFGQRDPSAQLRATLPRERVTLRAAAALGALAGSTGSSATAAGAAAAAAAPALAPAAAWWACACGESLMEERGGGGGGAGPVPYGGRMLSYGGLGLPYGGLVRLELVECGVEPMAGAALEQLGSLQVGAVVGQDTVRQNTACRWGAGTAC